MNEQTKTLTFVVVALVVGIGAYVSQPKDELVDLPELVGKPMFKDLTDPSDAASMQIVKYDETLGELNTFRVARHPKIGHWTIPSHHDYPADAEGQMRDAATLLVDLKVLGIASSVADDHKTFGVVEPTEEQLENSDEGIGTLVAFEDKTGKSLASLIIGHEVMGADDQRFVRVPKQDPVYTVKVDPEKLSTKFEDWIDKDLLQLSSFDIEDISVKDYEVVTVLAGNRLVGQRHQRSDFKVSYDSGDADWKLDEMTVYEERKAVKVDLLETEELDDTALNDLKSAIDDLKIVDVRRKPNGLGADLKAGEDFMKDEESNRSLNERGFYPDPDSGQIYSANGEIVATMKNGVDYVLRFGNTAGASEDGEDASGLNRFLFVTTRVNKSKIPEPELEAVPELPKPAGPELKPKTEPSESESSEEDNKVKPDDADSATDTDDEKSEPETKPEGDEKSEPEDAKPEGEEKKEEEAEKKPVDTTELDAEIERIKKENQRKQDEYNDKVEEAEDEVRELNSRFADWYYVISEETFKKIHLSRNDIIKESDDADEKGIGVDTFRKLKKEGLKKDEEESDDT